MDLPSAVIHTQVDMDRPLEVEVMEAEAEDIRVGVVGVTEVEVLILEVTEAVVSLEVMEVLLEVGIPTPLLMEGVHQSVVDILPPLEAEAMVDSLVTPRINF